MGLAFNLDYLSHFFINFNIQWHFLNPYEGGEWGGYEDGDEGGGEVKGWVVIFLRGYDLWLTDRWINRHWWLLSCFCDWKFETKPTCVNNKCYEDLDDSNHRSSHFDVEQF